MFLYNNVLDKVEVEEWNHVRLTENWTLPSTLSLIVISCNKKSFNQKFLVTFEKF